MTKINEYIINNTKLIKEWDWEENSKMGIMPQNLVLGSNKNVNWICSLGHKWQSSPNNRIRGQGCPICAGKRVLAGYNDLASKNPQIAKQWHPLKNGNILPTQVTVGSNKKVWWQCERGHEWQTKIYHRTKSNSDCPICANHKILEGYNDLATTHPEIAIQWDYKKNNPLGPNQVIAGSNKKVWWKCEKGHSWKAVVSSRTFRRTGCPICSNQKVLVGYNDLATTHPEIAKQWDYEKNNKLTPKDIIAGSNKKYWWLCDKGHSYKQAGSDKISGKGCPICANKIILKGVNDFETTHPIIASQWNYGKNENIFPYEITYGSSKKVWWICNVCKHEWQATISSRVKGNGCPECAKGLQTSLQERTIFYYVKKHFKDTIQNKKFIWLGKMELDVFIPSLNIGIEYDGAKWHQNIENDLKKDEICEKNGIKLIRIREKGCFEYNSSSIKINAKSSKSNLEDMVEPIIKVLNIIDSNINAKIDIKSDYDEILKLRAVSQKNKSLLFKYPEIAKQWDYNKNGILTPDKVAAGSQKKVWWLCPAGHSYSMSLLEKTRIKDGTKCPICSNKRVLAGYNDLATTHPEIAKQWDYEKNGELKASQVIAGSNKKVWWKCERGHNWQAVIASRTLQKSGCPICANKKVLTGYNDLYAKYPELSDEWNYKLNKISPKEVLPGSDKIVWWICKKCKHEWQAAISSRTAPHKSGCPKCGRIIVNRASMKKVLCTENNKIYNSAKEAANELNLDVVKLRECARGQINSYKGFHFKYLK